VDGESALADFAVATAAPRGSPCAKPGLGVRGGGAKAARSRGLAR
jgi:hypothetical protein